MTQPTERLRLIALLRVSTKGQIDAYGLPAQRKDVKRWAKLTGHRLVDILEDKAISGTEDEREELTNALELLAEGRVDGLLFPNMDRLARELTTQEAILAVIWSLGGRAFTADGGEVLQDDPDDPMRTFVRQVMGAAAQLERGLISKRLRNGRKTKAEKGGYAYGAPRYGWETSTKKELGEVDGEQAGRVRAQELRAQLDENGKPMSFRAIGAKLKEEGYKTKRGLDDWQPATVARLLDDDYRQRSAESAARIRQQKKEAARAQKARRVLGKVS
ncbi:recombinase family protein [Streptomyces hesseae]|uniref:Recombinase family protein n=1 Tax=Streptomyces hesseae TaxID=3075519 RepID=A0ABU2SLT7_9ACTN|nr:recombinase family protein [Streptomyces sp. DSM 40473]MDT0449946.1 recombinase family protein [Streptomyces sp. DSM 40473]